MKKILLFSLVALFSLPVLAQLDPVSWTFSAVKKGDKEYEIQLKANIQDRWHMYSQLQPEDAIVIPTEIKFNPNPLFTVDGKIREEGKMEKYSDKALGVSANQYSGAVVFTQKIKLKAKAKTKITGTVEYQTCDDKKCLPPKTVRFSIDIK
jgi:thiol:disulfide interchange protein DsbD